MEHTYRMHDHFIFSSAQTFLTGDLISQLPPQLIKWMINESFL